MLLPFFIGKKMGSKKVILLFLTLGIFTAANSQINVPFDTTRWDIRAQEYDLTEYKGQKALYMKGGVAMLREGSMKNGVIEWDMAFPARRGFTGVRFRVEDRRNFEEFYFRPHQSGKPDANQYTPVYNGVSGWQLYHGDIYSVPYEYNFNKWFHVKMVVSGSRAELYIDNMSLPVLHIPFLKRDPIEGGLMVYGGLVPVYFANFSYTPQDRPALVNAPKREKPLDELAIATWSVSDPFPDSLLREVRHLDDFPLKKMKWKVQAVENSGTANLAAITDFDPDKRNTVFAKVLINSSFEQTKALHLGFSDRATVFCNGRAIFSGDETYRSRDFRYLGTIGYFDTVYLPLKEGQNEIWIAVTEAFGGWGIKGKLEDLEGIRIMN